jgi:uncharacterized protein (TIGR04255 family)
MVVSLVVLGYHLPVEEREIYPNAPVVLVALEVKHPDAGSLSHAQQRKIKQHLIKDAPIQRTGQLATVEGFLGPSSTPTVRVEKFPRYLSRDSTLSVSFRDTAVVVETTRYPGWRPLLSLGVSAWQARVEVGDIDGVERAGLRFVNEVRVPVDSLSGWRQWVDPGLLGPADVAGKLHLPLGQWQGLTTFRPSAEHTVVLRYGTADGYAVDPGGDLKRPAAHPPGPFFLIDIDSFWTPEGGVPDFDVEALTQTVDDLHGPVDGLFENLITERLREEVLRRGSAER